MDSRQQFEEAMNIPEGIYYSANHKAYRSVNGRIYEQGQACDANLKLEGWLKARESLVIELPESQTHTGTGYIETVRHFIEQQGIRTK